MGLNRLGRKSCADRVACRRRNRESPAPGRVALITGSGSGIGQGCAKGCAAQGAMVVVNDVNAAGAQKTLDAIKAAGIEDNYRHNQLFKPEVCDDCGAPMFADRSGQIVHAEMPEDTPTQQPLFH